MSVKKYYVTVDDAGTTCWYKDAKRSIRHRDGGPAIEYANGCKEWWQNDQYHRTDGPAIEHADGSKEWWQNDQCHRTDGPAVIYPDGSQWWYLNDRPLTEAEFLKATQPAVEMTVADVEKLVGKRVKIIK